MVEGRDVGWNIVRGTNAFIAGETGPRLAGSRQETGGSQTRHRHTGRFYKKNTGSAR